MPVHPFLVHGLLTRHMIFKLELSSSLDWLNALATKVFDHVTSLPLGLFVYAAVHRSDGLSAALTSIEEICRFLKHACPMVF